MRLASVLAIFACCAILASGAFAELPEPVQNQNTDGELVTAQQLVLSFDELDHLKKRLSCAVFRAFASQPAQHDLFQHGVTLDGAAVAVHPEDVKDVVSNADIEEAEAVPGESRPGTSMFGRGLDRATSPFRHKTEPKPELISRRQFYLTTADWLTMSDRFEIDIFGKRIKARLEFRDDARNLAILSTPANEKIEPVPIHPAENPMPGLVFVLLSPNSIYASLTRHVLSVQQEHLYGTSNLTARNGYPLFSASGGLAGLAVGPDTSHSNAFVVHARLIDRALHPEKYSRTTVEKIELRTE